MIEIEYKDTYKLDTRYLGDLVCTAMEGGINYWAHVSEYKGDEKNLVNRYDKEQIFKHIDYAINEKTHVVLQDVEAEDQTYVLNLSKLITGLKVVVEKYPNNFKNIREENYDADDADVLIQCALFGSVVFG